MGIARPNPLQLLELGPGERTPSPPAFLLTLLRPIFPAMQLASKASDGTAMGLLGFWGLQGLQAMLR